MNRMINENRRRKVTSLSRVTPFSLSLPLPLFPLLILSDESLSDDSFEKFVEKLIDWKTNGTLLRADAYDASLIWTRGLCLLLLLGGSRIRHLHSNGESQYHASSRAFFTGRVGFHLSARTQESQNFLLPHHTQEGLRKSLTELVQLKSLRWVRDQCSVRRDCGVESVVTSAYLIVTGLVDSGFFNLLGV